MKCTKIKELILTDYLDNQMDKASQNKLEEHLAGCLSCRKLEEKVRQSIQQPFNQAKRITPPKYLWPRIKETLAAQETDSRPAFSPLKQTWEAIFAVRKPALVLASALIIVILAVGSLRLSEQAQKAEVADYLTEQVAFLLDLGEEETKGSVSDYDDLDRILAIEEYFL
jgi:predicted anti-sigma-YlaC factor YlaD